MVAAGMVAVYGVDHIVVVPAVAVDDVLGGTALRVPCTVGPYPYPYGARAHGSCETPSPVAAAAVVVSSLPSLRLDWAVSGEDLRAMTHQSCYDDD